MSEELISVIDLASQFGKRKQTVFKILRRLRIAPRKVRGPGRLRGQLVSCVTVQESHLVAAELRSAGPSSRSGDESAVRPEALPDEHGVFYLLMLEPVHDPGRFKVGFAVNLPERLRTLKTAIDCVTQECEQLHTEVFRTQSMEPVVQRCERFFNLMPKL